MQQRDTTSQDQLVSPQDAAVDPTSLAKAIELIHARQYRQGERILSRYSHRFQPLYPDHDYLLRRGVDLIAFATAIEKGLDLKSFGAVIQYKAWPVDEFNRFNRADIGCQMINDAMRRFLDDPRHW